MLIPDVSGYKLDNALELLKAVGIEKISVQTTASPRRRDAGYNGSSRVIRQSMNEDGSLILLVCNIDFL